MSNFSTAVYGRARNGFAISLLVAIALSAGVPAIARAQSAPPPPAPLTLRIGDADFTVGGFLDAAAVVRSTAVGSGLGTTFGSIPLSNTAAGNLGETRLTAQNSRLSLLADSRVGAAKVRGYVEADFLGVQPANALVTSNANTLRMRLYWVQVNKGKFEFVGGQSWSMLTPNRSGVSPMPADVFFSHNADTNYQVGLTWTRAAQFRFIVHPTGTVSAGVALENPQQYVGPGVVLPASFPATEVDTGSNIATPNPYPDVIGKVAFDPKTGATRQHVEAAVVVRGFKTFATASGESHTAAGKGVSLNVNLEPVRNLHLIGSSFFSTGGGRYIFGLAPDIVVNGDGSPTPVASRSFIAGAEATFGRTIAFGYYGAAHADRTVATDVNNQLIGYGVVGAALANRDVTETTVGVNHAFWRDPRLGALQLIAQYSDVKRTIWAPAAGAPSQASSNMVFLSVRYVLP